MSEPTASPKAALSWVGILIGLAIGLSVAILGPPPLKRFLEGDESLIRSLMGLSFFLHLTLLGGYLTWLARLVLRKQYRARDLFLYGFISAGILWMTLASWLSFSPFETESWAAMASSLSSVFLLVELLIANQFFWTWRLNRHLAKGNHQAALKMLQKKGAAWNAEPWRLVMAGNLHRKLGNHVEGDRLIDQALEKSKRDPITLSHVASDLYDQQRYAEGLALIEEAATKHEPHAALAWSRCLFLVALERLDEARIAWDDLKRLKDPGTLFPPDQRDGQESLQRVLTALQVTL